MDRDRAQGVAPTKRAAARENDPMSKPTKTQQAARLETIAALRKMIKRGAKIYTTLNHCSASGMYRVIGVKIISHNEPRDISGAVAVALGWRWDGKHGGVCVGGCGMDMGFHVVYSLGRTLFPKGGPLPKAMHGRNGDTTGIETDGGYLLTHRWL
jgi:hypothetical protein